MVEINRLMDESENILEDPDKIEEVENAIKYIYSVEKIN